MRHLIEAIRGGPPTIWFTIPLEGVAREGYEKVRRQVVDRLGPLDDPGVPHVTVFYMGRESEDVRPEHVTSIVKDAAEAVAGQDGTITGGKLSWFEPSASSEGRTPIVIKLVSPGLERLNARLVRRLIPYTTKQQFTDYVAHATIGYAPRALTDADRAFLSSVSVPRFAWQPTGVNLQRSMDVLKRYGLSTDER